MMQYNMNYVSYLDYQEVEAIAHRAFLNFSDVDKVEPTGFPIADNCAFYAYENGKRKYFVKAMSLALELFDTYHNEKIMLVGDMVHETDKEKCQVLFCIVNTDKSNMLVIDRESVVISPKTENAIIDDFYYDVPMEYGKIYEV